MRIRHVRLASLFVSPYPHLSFQTLSLLSKTNNNLKPTLQNHSKGKKKMAASTSAVSMVMPLTQNRVAPSSSPFINPLPMKQSKAASQPLASSNGQRLQVRASSLKMEKLVSGLTAAALTASMVISNVAEAAGSDVSPSLKNFLLSIAAGGVVLVAIVGAVIGVSNFDPVKRS